MQKAVDLIDDNNGVRSRQNCGQNRNHLSDSGTGVAQVIAILAAVLTRTYAVIVIDEINSFLHPAAAKALIRILKTEHGDHQYIISTHSAEVISASQPNSL